MTAARAAGVPRALTDPSLVAAVRDRSLAPQSASNHPEISSIDTNTPKQVSGGVVGKAYDERADHTGSSSSTTTSPTLSSFSGQRLEEQGRRALLKVSSSDAIVVRTTPSINHQDLSASARKISKRTKPPAKLSLELGPRSPFLDAAYKLNIKKLDKHLKRGNVSASDLSREEDGDTLLSWMLKYTAYSPAQAHATGEQISLRLLKLGWDWTWRDSQGRDYLTLAVLAGSRSCVLHLIAQRHLYDWTTASNNFDSALHYACERGSADFVQLFLEERVFPIDILGAHRQTPLHVAVAKGGDEVVHSLIRAQASINVFDEWHESPLLIAAREGRVSVMRALLFQGAEANAVNLDGVSPLMVYLRGEYPIDGIDLLVEGGADVNARDHKGWPCLHLAAMKGNAGSVLRLLEYWARPDDKDTVGGSTALHIAVHKGDIMCAQALVNAGADINEREGITRDTPLCIAVRSNREPFVRYFLDLGASHADIMNDQSLMEVTSSKIREMLQLAEDGADTSDLLFMPRESVYDSPSVRAATVDQLVIRATYEKHPDINFLKVFLLTYRAFLLPEQLLSALESRWFTLPPDSLSGPALQSWFSSSLTAIRLRIINVMKRWLEDHPKDFASPGMITAVTNFAHTIKSFNLASSKKIEQALSYIRAIPYRTSVSSTSTANPGLSTPLHLSNTSTTFLNLDPVMIENDHFQQLTAKEFLNAAWTHGKDSAPTIYAITTFSTRLSYIVATEICSRNDALARAECITRALKIAQILFELSDFNGALAIIGGLDHSAVHRLKKSWASIGDKNISVYKKLSEVGASTKNYSNLRKLTTEARPPKMPYLGIYLKDVLQIEELPLYLNNEIEGRQRLVNFNKLRLTANIILNLQMYQLTPYTFEVDHKIQKFLTSYPIVNDDNSLFELSRRIEPKS